MFRLLGHLMPEEKSIRIALTGIYGIGQSRSTKILKDLGIPESKKVKEISEEEQKKLSDELKKYSLENDLKREIGFAIKRLREIKCYRGMRHNLGLPVRGQQTRTNSRTAKKHLGRNKVRPILKK